MLMILFKGGLIIVVVALLFILFLAVMASAIVGGLKGVWEAVTGTDDKK
jgi:hypothetical protein